MFIKQVQRLLVRAGRDLDEFRESVADLSSRECSQERKVQEGMHGGMVGSQAVLVLAIIDGHFDGHGRINESNDSSRDTDVVCVSAIRGACEAAYGVVSRRSGDMNQ